MRTRPFLLVLVCLALLGSACGGPMSKAEYEREAARIGNDVDESLDNLGQEPPTQADIEKTADALREATDEMEQLQPPQEVAGPHDRMIDGMRGMVATFDDLASELEGAKGDDAKMQAFLKSFNTPKAKKASEDLTAAQEGFRKEGYTVFGDGSAPKKKK